MILSYVRLALFAFGLLAGVQIPGFLHDYAQHVSARRLEINGALAGYQKTADEFFAGDLQALIGHYHASDDPVFHRDADNVRYVALRAQVLQREWQAMQGPWYGQAWHILARADQKLLRETWEAYQFLVLLKPAAIAWAIACGLLLAMFVEFIWLVVSWPARREARSGGRRQRSA